MTIKIIDWGLINYNEAWKRQEELNVSLQNDVIGQFAGYLIFCEHPHVFTLGKNANANNLLVNVSFLDKIGASMVKTNRGGDITYHGPGQLVGYPVLNLNKLNLGIKKYVNLLEETIINVIAKYGITGERIDGATGVWIISDNNQSKICAIGIRCSRSVTMHGFALNVNTNLKYFEYINPCGFKDKGVTSVEQQIGRQIPVDEIKKDIIDNFSKIFNVKIIL
jgi:lipoyl(octanoyl) transferase